MPKVLKSGIFSAKNNFPQNPPAGLKEQCSFCYARLETVENETVEFGVVRDRASGIKIPGWKIICPECGKKVFSHWPEIPANVYALLNGGVKHLFTN